ncbi:NAD(P)H-binding protein [Dyadobacter chenwenxiniae]|uniref:NAD(P)H-binding protein n=1 Tax=Dyadobacter chenwenxiniae TaxID=2906456 RepID=A0A9X1PQS6_9BACT|nr:NAD(P)H-binding protein [Dyadobacter chenwenxiniae]MCF0065221.1 NAD(P)H-binding protein [Dyadobacter chenwenxiniae]UON84509.1 NAD(P)H-binding protein [Dyadobacter chenwenxiniae]
MKIVLTGSLGHISRPLTADLIQKGHAVTVISSNPEREEEIAATGALPAVGSMDDAGFLTDTFAGADAVYTMVPPANYFDHDLDLLAYYRSKGNNYAKAIQESGVKRVVNLSTIGGHLGAGEGSGILLGAHDVELILNALPSNVSITHMRPVSFYYNLYGYVEAIKNQGAIIANYGAEDEIPWVSPVDIAVAVAEEIVRPYTGRSVRYVASDDRTGNDTAAVLGAAIGKPDLKWVIAPDAQVQSALEGMGMNPKIAAGLVEMYGSLHNGVLAEDYLHHKPVMGKVKLEDFAIEFAAAFQH